jgi:hypothetical protein
MRQQNAGLASWRSPRAIRIIASPSSCRSDYWLARLDRPLRWMDDGTERVIDHLVLAARYQGQSIGAGFESLTVGIAYVVDPSLLSDAALTFAKTATSPLARSRAPEAHREVAGGPHAPRSSASHSWRAPSSERTSIGSS